jgi:hypothetical protein
MESIMKLLKVLACALVVLPSAGTAHEFQGRLFESYSSKDNYAAIPRATKLHKALGQAASELGTISLQENIDRFDQDIERIVAALDNPVYLQEALDYLSSVCESQLSGDGLTSYDIAATLVHMDDLERDSLENHLNVVYISLSDETRDYVDDIMENTEGTSALVYTKTNYIESAKRYPEQTIRNFDRTCRDLDNFITNVSDIRVGHRHCYRNIPLIYIRTSKSSLGRLLIRCLWWDDI